MNPLIAIAANIVAGAVIILVMYPILSFVFGLIGMAIRAFNPAPASAEQTRRAKMREDRRAFASRNKAKREAQETEKRYRAYQRWLQSR